MKKLIIVTTAMAFALTAGVANACPKGTHLEGGVGAKHKGGKCVAAAPVAMKMDAKADAMKMDAKADATKMDAKADSMKMKAKAMSMKMDAKADSMKMKAKPMAMKMSTKS
jgi:hypothetical protein